MPDEAPTPEGPSDIEAFWAAKLPERAILSTVVTVVQYIDPSTGVYNFIVNYQGDAPLSSVLGLLELAKLDLVNRTPGALVPGTIGNAPEDEEDEEED